jgi:hypothetical protein
MIRLAWLSACVALLLAGCAAAPPPVGGTHRGTFPIEGRNVPLPPGEWRVMGTAANEPISDQIRVTGVVLTQDQDGRLNGLVHILVSQATPYVAQWVGPLLRQPACQQGASNAAVLAREATPNGWDCARLAYTRSTARPSNLGGQWVAYYDRRDREPMWAPAVSLDLYASLADRTGFITVIYRVNPEARGFARDENPAATSGWSPARQSQAQKDYIVRLTEWSRTVHPMVRQGFYGSSVSAPAF